ncbi:hypothetical protein BN1723_009111 [Verticillium longisporum]|uniref:JAB1/MPN/MOV34 metalloenzyme domain-containing protein n=1 Tax=Verticillium longisporum TaxID=100787 RepID=A0A0G4KLR0_VERLO|nr:hypothetical protein BN1723_009111 [Verticillium longisporum]
MASPRPAPRHEAARPAVDEKTGAKPDTSAETLDKTIAWAQFITLVLFQSLENAYFLSGKGVFGLTPAQQAKAARWSTRSWSAYVGLEIGRLLIERQRRKTGDVTSAEHKEWKAAWQRSFVRNVAWAPLTVHWSTADGFLNDTVVWAIGFAPATVVESSDELPPALARIITIANSSNMSSQPPPPPPGWGPPPPPPPPPSSSLPPPPSAPAPPLVYKWAQGINNLDKVWETENGECNVMIETELSKVYDKMELTLLNSLLRLIMDHNLADYITAKNNVQLTYKDMNHVNSYGMIRGLQFSAFVFQYYGLVLDLLLLGPQRASEIAGPPQSPNDFLQFRDKETETRHPIRLYTRYVDKIWVFLRFTAEDSRDLIQRFLTEQPDPNFENVIGFKSKKCWPRDSRMRLMRHDVNLGRAVFWDLKNRLPRSITTIEWDDSFTSVYSRDNPNLLFSMCGFEVRILPKIRNQNDEFPVKDSVWSLVDNTTKERTAHAFLQVTEDDIQKFNNRIRQILMSSGSTTFTKIANKWNTALIALFTYYREAAVSTIELLDTIVKCETKIQTRVKIGLNSKMPSRFPPAVFYTPKELGGLGMISGSHILIPASDKRWSKQTDTGVTHYRSGMTHDEETLIPNIFRYIIPWEAEFIDSQRVWTEYSQKRMEANQQNRRLTLEDLEDSWDRGLPRINTLFQKDRSTLSFDKGFRARAEFKIYQLMKNNPFWWTSQRHDGKLWNLNAYRTDVIQALGGVETILEHTLFKATGFPSWEGLFWEKACLAKGTMLLRYDSTKVAVEDVKEGDLLLGPDGGPRRAFNIVSGNDRLYRIKVGGSKEDLVVTPNHILVLHRESPKGNVQVSATERYDTVEMTATEFASLDPTEQGKHRLFRSPGFELPEQKVPVDPYFLGLWLGDRNRSSDTSYSNHEAEVRQFLVRHASDLDLHLVWHDQLGHTAVCRTRPAEPTLPQVNNAAQPDRKRPARQTIMKQRLTAGWTVQPHRAPGEARVWTAPQAALCGGNDQRHALDSVSGSELDDVELDLLEIDDEDAETELLDEAQSDDEAPSGQNSDKQLWERKCIRLRMGRASYGDIQEEEQNQLLDDIVDRPPGKSGINTLRHALNELGLLSHGETGPEADRKRIPSEYMQNSRAVRLAVLAGLLDTDGSYVCSENVFGFAQSKRQHSTLFWDAVALARSLGFGVWTKERMAWNLERTAQFPQLFAQISGNLTEIPCLLLRKQTCERFIPQSHSFAIKSISLESEDTEWAGFRVDQDQLYLRHDYFVLHNSGFEESMKFKKLTNAQRSGLNQIPNRRFTLWWSPTINRANVYVGFQVQLDLTGIFLHGKIPTLKISLIQIFRAHLWQKIHESVVMDLCQVFDQELESLGISMVQKETIHPRKSYKMNSSCADILLFANHKWNVTRPSMLFDTKDVIEPTSTNKFWVDFEQQTFASKTEWRTRAIATSNLRTKSNNIYVSSVDNDSDDITYVMPNNILKRFITIADLRVQVAGYLYGTSVPDNDQVKEIKCIVMIPQIGGLRNVQLPQQLPQHEYLENMEPLGVIHTMSGSELPYMSAMDVTEHAKLLDTHSTWDKNDTITVAVAFTPGSVSLSAWGLTPQGYKWGAENKDLGSDQPQGFTTSMGTKRKLLLSPRFRGFFLVPETGKWNYSFMGSAFAGMEKKPVHVKLDTPLPFYSDQHRPIHFHSFAELEDIWVDRQDNFA